MKSEAIIGISSARSKKEMYKWEAFLNALDLQWRLPNISLDEAVKKSLDIFRYAKEYCYTRKATLGEYLHLKELGCNTMLVVSRLADNNNPCNTTRYLSAQLNEYFKNEVQVIDCQIDVSYEKEKLRELGLFFKKDILQIEKAIEIWNQTKSKKTIPKKLDKNKINLLFLGGAPYVFSYSDRDTPMTRFLTNKLCVNLIGPKDCLDDREVEYYKKGKERIYTNNLALEYEGCFWPREKIMAAIYHFKDQIDGILLVRDKYCMGKMEEIDYFGKLIKNEIEIPSLIIDYTLESNTTTETALETFVEMISWQKKGLLM